MDTTTYTTYGSVRGGCGHRHGYEETAQRCLDQDRKGCRKQGGYSDRSIAVIGEDGLLYSDANCLYPVPGPGGATSGAARFGAR